MIYTAWISWVLPLLAVPLVPVLSLADRKLGGWTAVVASGGSFLCALYTSFIYGGPSVETLALWSPTPAVHLQVQVDGLSVLVAAFVSFVSFLVVIYSLGYMRAEQAQAKYYSLILLFIGAMLGLVMSGNLIQFYFFWEIVGVCSALLIGFWSDREPARRAGMKAFVVTRIGDASLLLAVLLIVAVLGTTSFTSVLGDGGVSDMGGWTAATIAVLVFIGAMGKSAQVPLHVWLPDAMEGPTTVSALIHAATMVNAGVFLMVRMSPIFLSSESLLEIVFIVGILSALMGGMSAFAAVDLKRLLAYSTISQLGLMFAAIGLGSPLAGTYQMVSQGLFKALAFLAAGSVIAATGKRSVDEMGGLSRLLKITYAGFLFSVLAMSGVPPLIGFWSKDTILSAAFGSGPVPVVLVLTVFALTSLYSFRALLKVFHGPRAYTNEVRESSPYMLGPIVALTASVVVGWVAFETQSLVPLSSLGLPDSATLASSMVVLSVSAVVAIAAFSYRTSLFGVMIRSGRASRLRVLLLEGFGFDRFYSSLQKLALVPLTSSVSRLQTGLLGTDVSLILLVVLAVVALFATGVLR